MKESLYDVLEVSRTASPEVIRAAYKSLVQRFHPDKNPDNPDAENLLKLINNAYETLSDPSKRAAYDVMLALEEMAAPQAEERKSEEEETPAAESESEQDFAEKWDLYQAFIGRNPAYYRPIFKQFHSSGKTAHTFHWAALLAGGGWAAYRKLYGVAALHFALLAAAIVLIVFAKGPLGLLALLPVFAMSAWLSFSANSLYFRHMSKRLGEISGREGDNAKIFRKANLEGGVNVLAPFVFAGLSLIVLLASSEIASQVQKPQVAVVVPEIPEPAAPVQPPPEPKPPAPLPQKPVETPEIAKPEPVPQAKPEIKPEPAPAKPKLARPIERRKAEGVSEAAPKQLPPQVAIVEPPRRPIVEASKYADFATAVSSGDRAAVEKMIKAGEDVNLVKNNQVPLIIAVKNGDVAMVRLLLSHGADVNLTDNQGNTAMIYAKVRADAKMIEILKNAGAKNPFD